jgi:hypothetical protein
MKLLSVTAMLRTTSTQTKMCKQNQTQWISNFTESQKEREEKEEEEEEENDIVLEEEKCRVKTYQDAETV